MKKYDITNIFYQYVVHERGRVGQDDKKECDIIALYPSEYKKQLLLTTKQRLELLSAPMRPINKPPLSFMSMVVSFPLKVIPKEIIFQQFTPGNSYNTTVTISNTDKISHFVKLICERNETFRIDFKGSGLNIKLAPGMSHVYTIQFDPHEKRDYEYQINLVCDSETLVIPIIALGSRAILDIPDTITIPKTAVKIPSSKTILVRNIGDSVAIFTASSSSSHFSIEPSRGVIKEEETQQFIIDFIIPNVGNFAEIIYLKYETGELLRIDVHATAFNCNIKLEKEKLLMADTFLSLSTAESLKIYNHSDNIIKFQWMKYKDTETDNTEKKKFTTIYDAMEDRTNIRHIDSDYMDLFDSQTFESICKRVHTDELASLAAENFLYNDSKFILSPMSGEIWPRSFIDVTVTFQPNAIGEVSNKAYLEVTGHETRLPLSFSGIGKGPMLKLNTSTLDIGKIYLGSIQNFEIVCTNEGLIPGVLIPSEKSSDFGGNIYISPQILEIQPGEYSSFNLSFSSSTNGEFIETVEFLNQDNSETLFLYIKGHVICPTIHFDQPQLDLGTIALGFTSKHEISIRNVSLVPVTFSISILDDGYEPVITYETFITSKNISIPPSFPLNPREFFCSPNNATLTAHSALIITVNFTPNIARIGKTHLQLIIQGSNTIPVILPILYESKVASCDVQPSELYDRFAFINFPYTLSFTVKNTSTIEGFFYFLRESKSMDSSTFYSMSRNQWHLKPGQTCAASITIITRAIGRQEIELKMKTFGKNELDMFTLVFNGHGPVISIVPKQLDFGDVELLQKQSMSLELINDSPIPTNFKAHISNKNSSWSISTASGEINPFKSTKIIVKLLLRDTGKQSDKILITVVNSLTTSVTLNAHGLGCNIKIHPNIFPDFNMGQLLTYQDNFVPLILTNEGNRWQKLIFSNTTAMRNTRTVPQMPSMTTFKIEPHVIDMPPRSTDEIKWLVHSDICETISEQWWVYSATEGCAKRELIGMINLSATFVEPTVKFNKSELNFYINMESGSKNSLDKKIIDELEMINMLQMSLKVHLSIQYPFKIIIEDEKQVNNTTRILDHNFISSIRICFSPNINDSQHYSNNFTEYLRFKYAEHPNTDNIKCKGAVNYPNIVPIPRELQFDVSLNDFNNQTILLNNNGPISVTYQFSWIKESINVRYIRKLSSSVTSQSCTNFSESINNDNNDEKKIELMNTTTSNEFPIETFNQIFEISPINGVVSPYSTAPISITFHARQTICLSAQLLCEVLRGPRECIKVTARADIVKYSLNKTQIDFGRQTLFKMCRDIIELSNACEREFTYKIHISLENQLNSKGILAIEPNEGSIHPKKTAQVDLNYQPRVPGHFEDSFNLTIGNMEPIAIIVKGWAILPQVYIPLPRIQSTKNDYIVNEYNAIKFLNIVEKNNTEKNDYSSINENKMEFQRLINNKWEVISCQDETIPEIMDIEMIIERHLAIQYINENKILTTVQISSKDPMPIPSLFSPVHELNMGCAIIEQYTKHSIMIMNYSSCKVSIRMKRMEKDNYLAKYGVTVKLQNHMNLMPKEFSTLDISIYPLKKMFSGRNKLMKRKIYIEVINGCTIPILIIANVTSPWLTINQNSLNFDNVTIGNSQLLRLFMRNDGLINCQWKIEFSNPEKTSRLHFHLDNYQGHLSPGEYVTINIYFQPKKKGYREAELNIVVHQGLAPQKIILSGRGIEKKLNIDKLSIKFSPVIPYSVGEMHELNIKNITSSSIEFYWHHLDHVSIEENRVIRMLLHYYQVDEILLPSVDVGSLIPQRLYDFYDFLIDEMIKHNNSTSSEYSDNTMKIQMQQLGNASNAVEDLKSIVEKKNQNGNKIFRMNKKNAGKSAVNFQLSPESLDEPNYIFSNSQSQLLESRSPDELEDSLHSYIDKLHEHPDFFMLKYDPLKEIFDELNAKDKCIIDESNLLEKQVCIIFHGAPFTQYQETACRVAKALNFPLINLDNAIIKIVALGDSSNSVHLRQLIDDKYQELLQIAMNLTNNFDHVIPLKNQVTKPMNSIRLIEYELERFKNNIHFNIPKLDDPEICFKNIPNIDEMNSMEPLCRYEYKIEAIQLLQNIIENSCAVTSLATANKSPRKKANKTAKPKEKIKSEKTFLNINLNLLEEILQEILNKHEHREGFVLETLNNNFIKTDVSTFSSILRVIGHTDSMLFVTFHNSLEIYMKKFAEKQNEITLQQQQQLSMRLKMMDEMSSSDFELLSDDEKLLFFEKVLRPRINEAQQRRMKFKAKGEVDKLNSIAVVNEKNKIVTNGNKKRKTAKMKDKEKKKSETKKLQTITEAFDSYKISLKSIESVIKDSFHIWHVKFSDPWDFKIYDLVVDQLTKHLLKKPTVIDNKTFEPVLESQLYSIVSKKYSCQRHSCEKFPFNLLELSCNTNTNENLSNTPELMTSIGKIPQPRVILQPKEVKTYKLVFEPTSVGLFADKFELSIAGGNYKSYQIDVIGDAAIPYLQMDPAVIFNNVAKIRHDESHKPTFFIDENTFDFGNLLQIKNENDQRKLKRNISPFNFFNPSLINVDIEFSLANSNWETFNIIPRTLSIKPNEFGCIHVTAIPSKLGINSDRLLLIIKNNPHVEEIVLECFGCELNVELSKKKLLFGRVLLFRREYKIVTLKNKSAVPIFWKMMPENSEETQIIFTSVSDWVKEFSENDIQICYYGHRIGTIIRSITLGIFMDEFDDNPLSLETISISGETYDVAIDVNDANPIKFNSGKIGKIIKASFKIKNRGQHDINFIIELENVEKISQINGKLPKNLREDFHITPSCGSLLPNKTTKINITFVPKLELNLKEAPLLKCNLLDTNKNPTVVAELPLTVTIRTEYSKFHVEPYPKLFFGPVSIFTHKQIPFYIKNIGIFPFQYKIVSKSAWNFHKSPIPSVQSKKKDDKILVHKLKSRKLRKTPKQEKSMTKSDQELLRFGPFTLQQNHEGTLNVNQDKEVLIDCYSETAGHLKNEILIFVDNCSIEDQNGRELKLSADFSIPKINFNNLDLIFQDSHVVNSIEDFICPSQIAPFSIFTKKTMCLHFERVIVSATHTVKLRLSNTSLVPAEVSLCLKPDELLPKNSPSYTFTLDYIKQYILPLNTQVFSISFTPTSIETYTGWLEASVNLPSHIESEKLLIKLFGEGLVADIVLIQPEIFCKRGHAILEYGRCLVGETSIKDIYFKNVGKICAKITTEIIEDLETLYEFKIADDVNHNKVGRHCVEVNSKPGEVTKLLVLFTPKHKGKYEAHVRLLITENPYESLLINLNGEGFIEPVVLIGLPLSKSTNINNSNTESKWSNRTKQNNSRSGIKQISIPQQSRPPSAESPINATSSSASVNLIYSLDFGSEFLNKKKKISFKMCNKSADKLFRFEWSSHDNFTFKPSTGHIYSLNDKDITVTFESNVPVSYNQIPLDCAIFEIKIFEKPGGIAWDDQHLRIDWINSSSLNDEEVDEYSEEIFMKKIVCPADEPHHEILDSARLIQLSISASTDDAIYSCSVDEINFEDILMFETSEQKFELKNTGVVNLIYLWKINESPLCHSVSSILSNSLRGSFELSIHDNNESRTESSEFPIDPWNESTESMNNKDLKTSFEIEPECGTLLSGQSKDFIVRFLPRNAVHYRAKLICNIEHLNSEMPQLTIFISGKGLLPYYHFNIPKNERLLSNKEIAVPPGVKIVEFKVIGVGKNYTKHFTFINPRRESYHYSWIDKSSQNTDNIPYFYCKIQDGIAESGERIKITFTFLARDVGVFEALWSFLIHEYSLEVPFLLVGIVTEPRVVCCSPKIAMAPIVLGTMIEDAMIIRNNEQFPLTYKIIEDSLYSEGKLQNLVVEPMSGILSPQNDQNFRIHFKPSQIGDFSFILQCEIEKINEPVKCFITVNVSKIESRVFFSNLSNEKMELQAYKINTIQLGKIMLNKRTICNFEITNMSDIALEYEWNLNLKSSTIFRNNKYNCKMEMNKIVGRVENKSRIISTLEVTAMMKLELINHPITLKIINGPLYKSLINATAKCSPIEFNFTQYNFGACYIKDTSEPSQYNVQLQITNNEDTYAIVECTNVPLNFIVNFEKLSQAIPERSTISIPVKFQPRETKRYHETLNFIINSDIARKIHLKGEGITYKVGLLTPRDKFIDFGNVSIGKVVKRKFTIINLAKASVKLEMGLIKKFARTANFSDIFETINDSINFGPSGLLTLRPNNTQEIVVKFSPRKRLNLFDEKIGGLCSDSTIIPLSFIRGRCIAAEYNLNRSHLHFDTVVMGFSIEDKLILHNTGDIGARFKWNIKKLGSYFTIQPLVGYSSAGKNVTFNVCFHPTEQSNRIKGEASIEIENYQSITVLFDGRSSKLPDPVDTILFSIPVRNKETKYVDIINDADFTEKIEIVVTVNYFQSDNIVFIDANSSTLCAITYAPLFMNDNANPHEGTLVMKFCRKNSMRIYRLSGISLPPEAIGKISREIPEKIKYLEPLSVHNWLNKPQYFICTMQLIGNYEEQPIYTFDGNEMIEILPNGTRIYQAVLCCYKGSLLNFKIIFTNSEGQYQFYELQYKIMKPETLETIELTTTAQESSVHLIKIENPLENQATTYSGNCQHPDIKIEGLPKTVAPGLKESITIKYSPTIASESETKVYITSTELGVFPYKLKLKATAPEKINNTLPQITEALGSSKTFNIVVKNNSNQTDEFIISIDNSSFTCGVNKISIPARHENTIEVTYEACNIGIVHAQLIISSTTNPEIIYNICGYGIIPKPKGPFIITPDEPLAIQFKNVFPDAKTFEYIVDPTVSFTTSSPSNVINSKQTANIMVRFQDMNGFEDESDGQSGNAVTGKLIVYCTDPEFSSINWIYYLKGTFNSEKVSQK